MSDKPRNHDRGDATPLIDDFVDDNAAPLCLLVIGEGFATTHPLPRSGTITLGRAPDADITIDIVGVSRNHARLIIADDIKIEDLKSANGTYVGDIRLVPGQPVPIAMGDPIELGTLTVIVQQSRASVRPRRIWTHGYFEARLEEECARGRRATVNFSLVRLRVIGGRAGGRSASAALVSALREQDTLAAYGPNDFELLLHDVAPGPALDDALQRMHMHLRARGANVRIGVASYPQDGRAAEALMAKACAGVMDRTEAPEGDAAPPVIVESGVMKRLHRLVERIAAGSINVLLLGETGVGKEIFASRVHALSPRAGKRMMRVNCAAFNESLVESELFGHVKGAFTGALQDKPGIFEACHGGSLFFDEIGDLPLPLQAKLLRVLEDGKVRRVGSLNDQPVEVRIIAATHRDLEAEVALGTFRQDLFFRLNGVSIQVPPLRDRVEEIEPMARMFLERSCNAQDLGPAPIISDDVLDLLHAYSWPGNLRELRNIMERAALLAADGVVQLEHLPIEKMSSEALVPDEVEPAMGSSRAKSSDLRDDLDARERELIVAALEKSGGNQSQAARELGISRGRLIDRIKTYGLPRPRKVKG